MKVGVIGTRDLINFNSIDAQIRYLENECEENPQFEPDVLVLNCTVEPDLINKWVNKLKKDNILVINADERKLYQFLHKCRCGVLTYGFNPKACITASSVTEDETVQVCVLRSFKSFAGEKILQQEFAVDLSGIHGDVTDILASVTVSLLCRGRVEL